MVKDEKTAVNPLTKTQRRQWVEWNCYTCLEHGRCRMEAQLYGDVIDAEYAKGLTPAEAGIPSRCTKRTPTVQVVA